MRKIIITLFFFFITILVLAKDSPTISNQRVSRAGEDFVIDFNIKLNEADRWYTLAVYISVDGGEIFKRTPLKAISGNVNYIDKSGDKTIKWKAKDEDISLLPGDNLAFKIEVEKTGRIDGLSGTIDQRFSDAFDKQEIVDKEKVVGNPPLIVKSNEVKHNVINTKSNTKSSKKRISKPRLKRSFFLMANVGLSPRSLSEENSNVYNDVDDVSYGFGLGYMFGRLGIYGKFRSNFNFQSIDYWTIANSIWTTGESNVQNIVGTSGMVIRLSSWLYMYTGVGYGRRVLTWEDVNGKWAEVTDYSYNGIAVDAGLKLKFGVFFLSGGVTTINFRYTDMEIGVGIMF